jgi:hypothetical protein
MDVPWSFSSRICEPTLPPPRSSSRKGPPPSKAGLYFPCALVTRPHPSFLRNLTLLVTLFFPGNSCLLYLTPSSQRSFSFVFKYLETKPIQVKRQEEKTTQLSSRTSSTPSQLPPSLPPSSYSQIFQNTWLTLAVFLFYLLALPFCECLVRLCLALLGSPNSRDVFSFQHCPHCLPSHTLQLCGSFDIDCVPLLTCLSGKGEEAQNIFHIPLILFPDVSVSPATDQG